MDNAMTDLELCYLSGAEALKRFGEGSLSPGTLMEALIARARVVEPKINAFADEYFDEALGRAEEAATRYANGKARRLEGLPVAVKDDAAIEGKRNTNGSLIYRDRIADHTDPHVERLLHAGAIVHARTACPEFCAAWVTYSRIHGVTRNPWNLEYTPGGSSGGSAAAVAAGTATVAVGSDNAGSIRQPASICGVVGYKPPHGRIPTYPPFNTDSYSVVGPITRTVADSALLLNVMAGAHPVDAASLRQRARVPLEPEGVADCRGLKIAYSPDLDYFPVDVEVRQNLEDTVAALRGAGAEVERAHLGWTERVRTVALQHYAHYYGEGAADALRDHRDLLTDYSVFYADLKRSRAAGSYGDVVQMTARMYASLGPILDKHHAFLCPTTALPSIPATTHPKETLEIEGRAVDADFGWCMTYPFNMLGQLPALAIPAGLSGGGLPTGIQVVARPFDDARAFRVAAAIEAVRPWDYRKPRQLTGW